MRELFKLRIHRMEENRAEEWAWIAVGCIATHEFVCASATMNIIPIQTANLPPQSPTEAALDH